MVLYVALLRAINVAGHARVEMTHVRDAFTRAGCAKVRTYIQSGNVIFDARAEECPRLFDIVRARVRALTSEQSTVIFRSARQVNALVKAAPFARYESDRMLKHYAVCLAEKPRATPPFPWHDAKERLVPMPLSRPSLACRQRVVTGTRF